MNSINNIFELNLSIVKYIRGFFYIEDSNYYFVITKYDNNKLLPSKRIYINITINFVPKNYVEYDFEVIQITSSYFHLCNFLYDFIFNYDQNIIQSSILITQPNNQITINNAYESDNETEYSNCSADGYDSEGFFFSRYSIKHY